MNSVALARPSVSPHPLSTVISRTSHSRREFKANTARVPLPWIDVAIANLEQHVRRKPGVPGYAWAIITLIVALHVSVVWYAKHHISTSNKPRRAELALEFVAPPKPLPPKVEPPKPQPPKPQPKQAQVLPPIQTAAPEPSNVPAPVSAEPPVAVAPVVSAPPPEPVTAAFGRAGYLNNPPPEYPAAASRAGWQGTVTLLVRVLANGKVEKVEVQKSSGRKVLDDEAARTVKSWTFSPSKRGSTAIDGWATVPIEFRLDS